MDAFSVYIFGNTCAGKSTVGHMLATEFAGAYVSFGDSKRSHIRHQTDIGKMLDQAIAEGGPIPPELCVQVMQDSLVKGWNFLSGCPISLAELTCLETVCPTRCAIHLSADNDVLYTRFVNRGACPQCQRTGTRGELCQEHGLVLTTRVDATQTEWEIRQKLYHERIVPFVTELSQHLPVLTIDVTSFEVASVVDVATVWIREGEAK